MYYAQREISIKIIQYGHPLMDVIYLTWEDGRFYVIANGLETKNLVLGLWYQRTSEKQVFNLGEYEFTGKYIIIFLIVLNTEEVRPFFLIDLFLYNDKYYMLYEISGSGLQRNDKTRHYAHDMSKIQDYFANIQDLFQASGTWEFQKVLQRDFCPKIYYVDITLKCVCGTFIITLVGYSYGVYTVLSRCLRLDRNRKLALMSNTFETYVDPLKICSRFEM